MISLDLLLEAARLKALPRAGWVRKGVANPETVGSHSWGVAWLVLALAPEDLDRGKALAYATLHDLAEVRVGDITPVDRVSPDEKARRERAAIAAMAPQLLPLWDSFEALADREARFVREVDKLDMALQALGYHLAGQKGMGEFVDSAEAAVHDPALRPWIATIRSRMSG